MMKVVLVLSVILTVFSCDSQNYEKHEKIDNDSIKDVNAEISSFYGSKGVATFIPSDDNLAEDIVLMNEGGSEFVRFNLRDELAFMLKDSLPNFLPLEYYPDYYVLKFEIQKIENDSVWVFIDEGHIHTKVLRTTSSFRIENWEEYFLESIITADFSNNQTRASYSENSEIVNENLDFGNYLFKVVEINGDWIKIQCAEDCEFNCKGNIKSGWIKWKDKNDKVLIHFPSAC